MNPHDTELLIRDKYNGERTDENEAAIEKDVERLAAGEPLAYVIGWVPFLGLHIELAAPSYPKVRALIPRSETEWWTEKLLSHLKEKFGDNEFKFLDLCAGSGAIGLAVLQIFPNARVTLVELVPELAELIKRNVQINNLDDSRVAVLTSELYESIPETRFDILATNPPYIPEDRKLDESVTVYEPHEALFSGADGMTVIDRILENVSEHLNPNGELWMECDIANIHASAEHASTHGAQSATIHEDLSGRPRLLVAHYR